MCALPYSFQPKTGTMESWNAAYVRVEDYLRAHRIHNRLHQSRLIQKILEEAAARHEARPAVEPTTIASEVTEEMMDAWFAQILERSGEQPGRLAVDGRVALLLCDGPEHWPYALLDRERSPPDLVAAMRSSSLEAGPDLAVSSMVPRPLDFGRITTAAGETFERIERWPVMRTLLLWIFFASALGGVFYLTR
jgi:hypothetical protein